ncbi:DNA polymerase I [Pseudodesulfovibrio senegalensis]|uniref:DNA polymerase I n=1 Tax=Pseudodesulfovibrio senegalensis TaxID=1721087 RepID=A0A6N6N4E2_9BACT|nr:DNA polymerase I [Pseudodesulfovibrio senegalensis]KAB1442074.1 DNA polymerase I [Pseudodesulfovibrio senegalensis]
MSLKQELNLDREPIFLIDGTALFYRAFYARADLKRADGFPTNAINTTIRSLLNLLKKESPSHVGFIMDGRPPTFRNELYDQYKANRPPMPEALAQQIDPVREAVQLMGLRLLVSDGVEADDCIASLTHRFKNERPVIIVGSDKDLKQCLDTNVFMLSQSGRKEKLTSLESFTEEEGLAPQQWPDFQALIGDSADNIPGIPKVGPVTARKIMAELPTLEAIRDGYETLPPKLREKVEPELDNIFLYRKLTRMRLDCCPQAMDEFKVSAMDAQGLRDFLETYELRGLMRSIPAPQGNSSPTKTKAASKTSGNAMQGMLLDVGVVAPVATDPIKVTAVDDLGQLPDVTDREVGLVRKENVFLLGLDGEEYRYAGPAEQLASALAPVQTIATPSVQELLREDDAWLAVRSDQWFDLSLAAYLMDPEERNYNWERLRQSLYQDGKPQFDEAAKDLHPQAQGMAALAYMQGMNTQMNAAHLGELMRTLEIPLIPALVGMEKAGICINDVAFTKHLGEVSEQLAGLTRTIVDMAGEPFNIRSSQQMAHILFDKLELKPAGKTAGGQLSTANQVLEKIRTQHPVVEKILEYRMLEKLRSTYLEPLPKLAGPDGRIHTHFNQLATATGRLSSSRPNLQNIPIRGPQGKRMRACFTAGPNMLLAAADYSQIELRVLAHCSQDPELLDAFRNDEDIHSRTAALLEDKAAADITADERRRAKTINFGLIYGMGPQKLARELKITMNQAKEFIERYFAKLTTLREFYDQVVKDATNNGFVTTLAGRRRLLPDLHSRNNMEASQAKRQAINTVIQGSAADIIKMAMIKAHNDERLRELGARMILQVHDELLIESPVQTTESAAKRLREIMQDVTELAVPLRVDMGTGRTWADAH